MNLPDRCTQDMVDEQCSPLSRNTEDCMECGEYRPTQDMFPWNEWSFVLHRRVDGYLCESCVPRCQWLHNENGHVNLDLKPCGRIQSPIAQGPWCAEHDAESMKLDESEEA